MQTKSFGTPLALQSLGLPQAPLYERLPRGPHRLARADVLAHQRERIEGAMVQAVAVRGYRAVSVRQVITLAGVSRRSFYEHYANREDCLLATFESVAERILGAVRRAFATSDEDPEQRVAAALATAMRVWRKEPAALRLIADEAEGASRRSLARLRSTTARCGLLVARSAASGPHAAPRLALPPGPIGQFLAGGAQGMIGAACRRGGRQPPGGVEEALTRWFMLGRGGFAAAPIKDSRRDPLVVAVPAQRAGDRAGDATRARMLDAALHLGALHEGELTAAEIAGRARLPVEQLLVRFAGSEDCYATALEEIGELAASAVAAGVARGESPSEAVLHGARALLGHLASHPLHAHTLGHGALVRAPAVRETNRQLARRLMVELAAPVGPPGELTLDALAGALLHVVGCLALRGRVGRLPALTAPLAAVALAALAPTASDGGG